MMNPGNTWVTAMVRAAYAAIITGAIAGLTASQSGSADRDAILTGVLAALSVLAMRGGLEGAFDARRNAAGDVRRSDVTPS